MTDSSRPLPDDPSQRSSEGGTRPAALEPSTNRAMTSSLPWRPSDTGLGEGGLGNGSTATLDPLSEQGLERLAETLDGQRRETDVFVTRCSWCHRFDVEGWCDAPTAARRLHERDPELFPTITHGICDVCVIAFEQSL